MEMVSVACSLNFVNFNAFYYLIKLIISLYPITTNYAHFNVECEKSASAKVVQVINFTLSLSISLFVTVSVCVDEAKTMRL